MLSDRDSGHHGVFNIYDMADQEVFSVHHRPAVYTSMEEISTGGNDLWINSLPSMI